MDLKINIAETIPGARAGSIFYKYKLMKDEEEIPLGPQGQPEVLGLNLRLGDKILGAIPIADRIVKCTEVIRQVKIQMKDFLANTNVTIDDRKTVSVILDKIYYSTILSTKATSQEDLIELLTKIKNSLEQSHIDAAISADLYMKISTMQSTTRKTILEAIQCLR